MTADLTNNHSGTVQQDVPAVLQELSGVLQYFPDPGSLSEIRG
jgi:hypothetical protein